MPQSKGINVLGLTRKCRRFSGTAYAKVAWFAVYFGSLDPASTPSLDHQAGGRQLQTTRHHPAAALMMTVQHDHGTSPGLDPMSWHVGHAEG